MLYKPWIITADKNANKEDFIHIDANSLLLGGKAMILDSNRFYRIG